MNNIGRTLLVFVLLLFYGNLAAQVKNASFTNERYRFIRDSLRGSIAVFDSTNLFDDDDFIPGKHSFDTFLLQMDEYVRTYQDAVNHKAALNAFRAGLETTAASNCREMNCELYAEVNKSEQRMYLFLNGQPVDTFKVSTGAEGYETPDLNLRPSGPVFEKYSSKKYPGGNYKGLGNMPYAVFIKGGYAIHGTTTGNIAKLGTPASHGCVRLHPDDARLFNQLVREIGLENTWIRISD